MKMQVLFSQTPLSASHKHTFIFCKYQNKSNIVWSSPAFKIRRKQATCNTKHRVYAHYKLSKQWPIPDLKSYRPAAVPCITCPSALQRRATSHSFDQGMWGRDAPKSCRIWTSRPAPGLSCCRSSFTNRNCYLCDVISLLLACGVIVLHFSFQL